MLERVITALARSRGFDGLEELARATNAATGKDYTALELADWPRVGFGRDLDAVLGLSGEERDRLVGAVLDRIQNS
jgi:hypothetical protein